MGAKPLRGGGHLDGAAGVGITEQLTFTAPVADTYGFVLINNAGSGSYTVHADTTAPSGEGGHQQRGEQDQDP